jgi:hypothetical protein
MKVVFTVYSSFEIRFRLNSTILLPTSGSAPTVDFKFQTYLSKSISFTHKTYLIQIQTMRVLAFLPFAFQEILMVMEFQMSRHDSDNDGIPDNRSSSH